MSKNVWINFALVLGGIGFLLMGFVLYYVFSKTTIFSICPLKVNMNEASELGGLVGGLIGIFWSSAGAILIFATFQEQKKLAEKQQFENSFFQMLSTLQDMLNTTSGTVKIYSSKNKGGRSVTSINGREFFYTFLESFKSVKYSSAFKSQWRQRGLGNMIERFENKRVYTRRFVEESYIYAYRNNQKELGHFFRLVFNIIKFTIEERKKYKDEKRYINLIQAQLSNDLLALLFYNSLTSYSYNGRGEPQFFNWLDRYESFENIDCDSLLCYFDYRFYPNTRFKYI